jgi:S-DNA-T family DNA segregation ATPase FtsK/SpoIIIE
MAEDGIVGQYNGSKARDVLLTMPQWNQMQGIEDESGQAGAGDEDPPEAEDGAKGTQHRRPAIDSQSHAGPSDEVTYEESDNEYEDRCERDDDEEYEYEYEYEDEYEDDDYEDVD